MTEPVSSKATSSHHPKKKPATTSSTNQPGGSSSRARPASPKPAATKPVSSVIAKGASRPTVPASISSGPKRETLAQKRTREVPQAKQPRKKRRDSHLGLWLSVGGTVAAVVGIIVLFAVLGHTSTPSGAYPVTAADPTVVQEVTTVSPSVLAEVSTGQGVTPPSKISGSTLTGPTGKPEVFYYGAEYCPYCAAERWAMIVALSRFGTFSDLHQTTSSSTDIYPSTHTFSFYGSSYTSQYVDFVPLEVESYNGTALQTPTSAEQQLVTQYNPNESFPFVDIANQYAVVGASYSPQVLSNLTWQQIAGDLFNAQSTVAQNMLGTANYITAAICNATSQQPASVCQADPIPAVQQSLSGSSTGNTGIPASQVAAPAAAFRSSVLER